ncbi:MAG: hypothetical protein QM780_06515 [Hyphomicrobium sp.]|uniref:hypothetical protein n=1 Tax=Hyphomicrobium sp. TaxID=82 RepID=UPI0039E6A24E
MAQLAQVTHPPHDDWVTEFKERAVPRLRTLFTAERDFTVLPDIIAEPLRRLSLAEKNADRS